MNKIVTKIIIGLLSLLVVCLIINCYTTKEKKDTPNTLPTIVKKTIIYDTIYIAKPPINQETIIDTIRIKDTIVKNDTITIFAPLVQKHYYDTNHYSLWISGCNPLKLDSINIFQAKETETHYIEDESLKIYGGGKIGIYKNDIIPYLSISATKKDWLVGLELGVYNNKAIYGFEIKYKIK
jgi:hypothetical protein